MSSKNNDEVISIAKPHTIKKFELIENYVESWSQILLNSQCENLVYIDCMSNSGEYRTESGECVYGTAVRVARILRDAAFQYPTKHIYIVFNDYSSKKIAHLKQLTGSNTRNFHIDFYSEDANSLLKRIAKSIRGFQNMHTLLIYDPYVASIDWTAILPFINRWGEVILNHMVSDTVRSIGVVKRDSAKEKYEMTYQCPFEELIPYGTDRTKYEKRVEDIIQTLRRNKARDYYVAAFPFFIRTNVVEYNLVHCTSHIRGFTLYKNSAWKTFEGKSSMKNTHGAEDQLQFDLDGSGFASTFVDNECYSLSNVAEYLSKYFAGQADVNLQVVWGVLEEHPIFPSDFERKTIKKILKENFGAVVKRSTISFPDRS